MSKITYETTLTLEYLMRKTKNDLAFMYLRLNEDLRKLPSKCPDCGNLAQFEHRIHCCCCGGCFVNERLSDKT